MKTVQFSLLEKVLPCMQLGKDPKKKWGATHSRGPTSGQIGSLSLLVYQPPPLHNHWLQKLITIPITAQHQLVLNKLSITQSCSGPVGLDGTAKNGSLFSRNFQSWECLVKVPVKWCVPQNASPNIRMRRKAGTLNIGRTGLHLGRISSVWSYSYVEN